MHHHLLHHLPLEEDPAFAAHVALTVSVVVDAAVAQHVVIPVRFHARDHHHVASVKDVTLIPDHPAHVDVAVATHQLHDETVEDAAILVEDAVIHVEGVTLVAEATLTHQAKVDPDHQEELDRL
jgi:hypothetical protein